MSLRNNTPNIYEQYRKQGNATPSIEDGNPTDNTLQGRIFTSEVTTADGYSIDYLASVVSVVANSTTGSTGNNYTYTITLTYAITLESGATIPGFFGDNIIIAGEPFLIQTPNIIRGMVNRITSAPPPTVVGSVYTYVVGLDCTITQGDPSTISTGSIFLWKTNYYTENTNFQNAYPPVKVESTYNQATGEVFFYWKNINELSYSYNLDIRNTGPFPWPQQYIRVPGNTANPKTVLTPFIATIGGAINAVKISDPGVDCSGERSVKFIGPGSGAVWGTTLDDQGSLLINEFDDPQFLGVGAITTPFQATSSGQPIDQIGLPVQVTSAGQPLDNFTWSNTSVGLPLGIYPGVPVFGGSGSGALFTVVANLGTVQAVSMTNPGSGYQLPDAIGILGSAMVGGVVPTDNITFYALPDLLPTTYTAVASTCSGTGTGATFTVAYDSASQLSVTLVSPGAGYFVGDLITISAANIGGGTATDITFTVDTLVPITYSPTISVSSALGVGAEFSVNYDNLGIMTVSILDAGWYYTGADVISIPSTEVGAGSATNITFMVAHHGNIMRIRSNKTKEGYADYPIPNLHSYISGLPVDSNGFTDFRVSGASQTYPGSNRYWTIAVKDATTTANALFPLWYTTPQVQTHEGIYRISAGTGYNQRTRAEVKKIPEGVKYYYDPVINSFIIPGQTYAWKVSANLDEINKLYTEWTDEVYIKT